MTFVWISS